MKIPVTTRVYRVIPALISMFFISSANKASTPTYYDRFIRKFFQECGFTADIRRAHIFRRTFATRRHEEGWQTEEIKKRKPKISKSAKLAHKKMPSSD